MVVEIYNVIVWEVLCVDTRCEKEISTVAGGCCRAFWYSVRRALK